jgi:uncharacterized repeat protein (TIGR01451 family)
VRRRRSKMGMAGLALLTACAALVPSAAYAGGGTTTGADIQVSGSASTGSPGPGQRFSYTFQVKNSGPQTATAVSFTDTLPVGTSLGLGTVNGFSAPCTTTTDANGVSTVSCNLFDIAKGGQTSVVVYLNAPITAGTFSNTGTATSSVADPQPSNNTVTVTAQVKVASCPLPAGQTTVGGLVAWKDFNSAGMFEDFHFYGNDGVQYDVITNFYDGSAPLTTVINLNCAQVPNSWIQVANSVAVTGTVGTAVLPGATVATPVIYASVIQVPFFKDGI